jgi:PPM family protein phosphatase
VTNDLAPARPVLTLETAGLTHTGRVREQNEDCLGDHAAAYAPRLASHGQVFAVADGMGGHERGEFASQLAIDTLFEVYYRSEPDPPLALRDAVLAANNAVFLQAQAHRVTMGTTLAVAIVHERMLIVANVGDSRVYRVRDGQIRQLTQDHSLLAEQVRRGLISLEEARESRLQNVITRCIGNRPRVEVDISESPLRPGDVVVLCTDGLHGLVGGDELAAAVAEAPLTAAAEALIALANDRGGPDNITCLLVRVLDDEPAEAGTGEAPVGDTR